MVQGPVYLITGGSSGLGRATTVKVLSEGGCVTIVDIQEPLDYSELKQYGDRLLFQQVDVTDEDGVASAIAATKTTFGMINVVVNCAGIALFETVYDFTTNKPHDLQAFAKVINVNLTGTFNVIRLVIPLLIQNEAINSDGEKGVIITTSSILGYQGTPESIAYSASKAAIMALCYPLAKGLGDGIRVVDIAPGLMDTPMVAPFNIPVTAAFPKRMGKPIEYAELVKTITESALLNGSTLRLDAATRN